MRGWLRRWRWRFARRELVVYIDGHAAVSAPVLKQGTVGFTVRATSGERVAVHATLRRRHRLNPAKLSPLQIADAYVGLAPSAPPTR